LKQNQESKIFYLIKNCGFSIEEAFNFVLTFPFNSDIFIENTKRQIDNGRKIIEK